MYCVGSPVNPSHPFGVDGVLVSPESLSFPMYTLSHKLTQRTNTMRIKLSNFKRNIQKEQMPDIEMYALLQDAVQNIRKAANRIDNLTNIIQRKEVTRESKEIAQELLRNAALEIHAIISTIVDSEIILTLNGRYAKGESK